MFDNQTRQLIKLDFQAGAEVSDLAIAYGESASNIRRALHEEKATYPNGEVYYLKRHKADWEIQLLDILSAHGLDDPNKLRNLIIDGLKYAQLSQSQTSVSSS